jgi:uncharacterized protein with PIN domain
MLGRVARVLRLLGFDTVYFRDGEDLSILAIGLKERRILLTADRQFFHLARGWGLQSVLAPENVDPWKFARKVVRDLNLEECVRPFTRCPKCNGEMHTVHRDILVGFVHPYVWHRNEYFAVCKECGQIYWEGTHVERIRERLLSER